MFRGCWAQVSCFILPMICSKCITKAMLTHWVSGCCVWGVGMTHERYTYKRIPCVVTRRHCDILGFMHQWQRIALKCMNRCSNSANRYLIMFLAPPILLPLWFYSMRYGSNIIILSKIIEINREFNLQAKFIIKWN